MKILVCIALFMLNVGFVLAQNKKLWWDKNESGKYGVVELSTKKVVVDYKYDEVKFLYEESNGFKTKLNGKYGIIDRNGKEAVMPKFDEINFKSQSSDWIETKLNGKFGFMDINGKGEIREIFPPKYDEYWYPGGESVPSGYVNVRLGDKWTMIDDITGKPINTVMYDEIGGGFYNSSLQSVKLNNKWGFIDKKGKQIIPCKYDKVGWYSDEEKKAYVTLNGRDFYVNLLGKEVK